jgi:hypothetical protein
MDNTNSSFNSSGFYGNGGSSNSAPRYNNILFRNYDSETNRNGDTFRTMDSPFDGIEENSRNLSIQQRPIDIQRRNTVTGNDSPFLTRRRVMLQSTPITNRRIGERFVPSPSIDCSTITTATENAENKQRAIEDRNCIPHFFGSALLTKSQPQNNDILSNKFPEDNDARPNLKAPIIPSRLGYSSCNRSNTFVIRKDPINKETTRFSPYSRPEKPKGPPLRSLNDSLPIIKRRNEDIPQVKEPVAEDEKDFWVTVFGFDKEKGVQPILELFGRHGQIVKTALPNNDSNYIHIRYTTKAHVDQALQRNGHMNDNYFIGVIQSPYVSYGSMSNEYTIETPAVNGNAASVEKTVAPISTSSPSNSPRYINGIRSLAAPVRNPPSVQQSKASSLINFLFKGKSSE